MTKKLAPAFCLCALLASGPRAWAQNGPDNDPDAAPGYVNSVFHHSQLDSINLYNGQLTIPIAIGPAYPIGPKLHVQLTLNYNSRREDFGKPTAQDQEFFYKPFAGNPALGIGWELTLGAIKPCQQGVSIGQCYSGPDGSQHMFNKPQGNGMVSGDGSALFLKGSGPYEMWDGDGNHYDFGWHVSGFDDGAPYVHDFGRGRSGWYVTAVTDPFGNSYSVTYQTNLNPVWTYGASACAPGVTTSMEMANPSPIPVNSWVPRDITLASGGQIHVHTSSNGSVVGLITSVDFPEFVDGVSATRTWTLKYAATPESFGKYCGSDGVGNLHYLYANLQEMSQLQLPSDLAGAPSYQFTYTHGYLTRIILPTAGSISYCYALYNFFHGRAGALAPGCAPIAPPASESIAAPTLQFCGGSGLVEEQPGLLPGECTLDNNGRWTDQQYGVTVRTEKVGTATNVTTYSQIAFPHGEAGSGGAPTEPQTLTIVTAPPTDKNAAPDPGRRRSKAVLFASSPYIAGGGTHYSVPGDRIGAAIEERTFEKPPTSSSITEPACTGNPATDQAYCGSRAARVVQTGYDYDNPTYKEGNRRLQLEKSIYGAAACASCKYHQIAFSLTAPDTWESNGRHYNTETHSGTLGGDARTIATDWAPVNWLSGPPAGGAVLPNLSNQRTEAQGSFVRDQYFDFDLANGFLKGSFVYDAGRDIAFVNCRYNDGHGNTDKEFSRTLSSSSLPPRTYCSNSYPTFPGSVGVDGDMFGKDYTYQSGQLLTVGWIKGSGAPPFFLRNVTRDAVTGWVKTSADSSGRTTSYTYDSLGRVNQITSPSPSDLRTWVCYEGPNATTAYRASAKQSCPVASSNAGITTWEHYDYDGLGRKAREKRLQPASAVSKRFTLYDGAGNPYFSSEWVPEATSEAVSANLATGCVFTDGTYGTYRPSAAPGTYSMCWDPFGRPQQIVGAKHSSLVTVDRLDGPSWYSDTRDAVLTYCVNGTFTNQQMATCSSGGINSSTTTQKDAFGRITNVTEPGGESTGYAYDANGKLTTVTQGSQNRSFGYDAAGFLRSETTPERGSVTYDTIGSLGNVRTERQPGGLTITRLFDFAGRLTEEDAGGSKYTVNCYDGLGSCADGRPNYAGGAYPNGKLTRRYGYNWIPTAGPVVDEQFAYSDAGGRLSTQITAAGNGDLGTSTTQTWTYNSLGLPATHNHPRPTGVFPVTTTYVNGLPTSISGNGQNVVTAATYNPAAGLASWTAGNGGTPVVTTITQDATMLPRPAIISNPLWSSGAYTYDSTGDILKIGGTDSFSYDVRSRLTNATYGTASRSFTYDRYGNLLSAGTTTYCANICANNRLPSPWAYDARGNLTTNGVETLSYDSLDRQYRDTNAGSDWIYLFNGAGERLLKFPSASTVLRREMARYVAEANILAKGWTLPPCSQVFTDVSCADPDAQQIQLAYSKGITAGCSLSPLQYCPDAKLTRAQMAVFVVRGYKPDGFAPPACQGTFQDVTCSGPYAGYAPWIEQLYRDGVTVGCNSHPLQFCPGSNVGEWEMLVWLAKGGTGGVPFWSAYHPVPRGSIYTWRDEQNRVVTEAAGGASGLSTATLSVTRDNVFLGNLLVASYVASPAGWQYTASDHLASPRVVFNQSGQLLETHKYWPYGEDTNATPPSQRLAFSLMERDTESTRFHDHARSHDYVLGRFVSPDSVGGHPASPQSWNRYAYTLGNPMKHIDPDGRLTIVIHGTGARGSADFLPGGRFFEHVVSTVPDRTYASFQWSGKDSHEARVAAATALVGFVRAYHFAPGERLNVIVAHSHGGNVGILGTNLGFGQKLSNLITLGTPSRDEYHLRDRGSVGKFTNVFNSFDQIQVRGGGDGESRLEIGPAARTQPYALNVNWNVDFGPIQSHFELHSPAAWDFTLPHLDLDESARVKDPTELVWRE